MNYRIYKLSYQFIQLSTMYNLICYLNLWKLIPGIKLSGDLSVRLIFLLFFTAFLSWTKFSLVARLFQLKYELWSAKMLLSLYPDFLRLIPKIIFVCDGIPFLRNNQLIIFAIRPNFVSWNQPLKICSHEKCLYQILK